MSGKDESKGLLHPVISGTLLGKIDIGILKNPEFQTALPELKNLYRRTWRWHGTGRFHYHKGKIIDVLNETIKRGGLIPHKDPLDYTRGIVYTVSSSPSRTYSSLYAQLHFEKGLRLRHPFQTTIGVLYYLSSIVWSAAINDRRLFTKEFREKNKLNHEGRAFFRDKYSKEKVSLTDYLRGGVSDIKGNYPILIGIKEGVFQEANIAKVYSKYESRSETPIPLSGFTHLEVPEHNVTEVRNLLKNAGKEQIPIIPLEWGEEFCKSLPVSFLKDGIPLKN